MSLKQAHHNMVRALASLTPASIRGAADAPDVENRAEHLQDVYWTVMDYMEAALADTITHLPADGFEVKCAMFDGINEPGDYDVVAALVRAGCPLGGLRAAA